MGANLSQFIYLDDKHYSDCVLNGNEYSIKGTYVINVLICGQSRSGKTLLFKNLQKSSLAKTKKQEIPLESTTIEWYNLYTLESANVVISDLNFEMISNQLRDSSGIPNKEDASLNQYETVLRDCHCLLFVADPRKDDLFDQFRTILKYISKNTVVIVLNNFADMKDSWIHSSDEIKRGCQDIIDQSHKSVEFWNIETSIGKGYGFGELYHLLLRPFYQVKMKILQEMTMNTIQSLDITRDKLESNLEKSSYERFCERARQRKRDEESSTTHSRDFVTQHSFYLHEHSNRPETIISSKKSKSVNYDTISNQRVEDYRNLESGSDCDEISPIDAFERTNKAIPLDPSILSESLADFFEDVEDEELVASKVSKLIESIPVVVGAAKEELNETPKHGELITEAYPIPENYIKKTDDVPFHEQEGERNDDPSMSLPIEESMGFSK